MATEPLTAEKSEVIQRLRAHGGELRESGVRSLALFGSIARGEANADSDVDVLVDLAPMGLFSEIHLEQYLSDLIGRKVDLVPRDSLKPQLRESVEREAVRVF